MVCGGKMNIGELVFISPKNFEDEGDHLALIISKRPIGSGNRGSTTLYDVLLTHTNEVITITDIYFTMRRL